MVAAANSRPWDFADQDILIGDSPDDWWEEFAGLLDDVRIYDRVLSAAEVKALASMGDAAAKEPELKPGAAAPPKTLTLDLGGGVKMECVYIKPGTFIMGGDYDKEGGVRGVETPRHEVAITKGFYLGKYEATQAQFQAVTDGNPSTFKGKDLPVETLTCGHAADFCRRASAKTGHKVRLPTEAEWEYACRAGTDTDWSHGSDPSLLVEFAWTVDNAGSRTHPVGQKKPNPWGLYDTYGNVQEWVADKYSPDYYASSPREDPPGPKRGKRFRHPKGAWIERNILRGGCWKVGPGSCTSAYRLLQTWRYPNFGFRVAVSASAQKR
jgi:formylglycine-generating enzyme required for sulfatase activity